MTVKRVLSPLNDQVPDAAGEKLSIKKFEHPEY
jgi:hypothetical protein